MGRRSAVGGAFLVALLALVAPQRAEAREVVFPLNVDYELLRQTLLAQVFTDPDHTARLWDDGSGCNELVLSDPEVSEGGGGIRIESRGRARAGFSLLSYCLFSVDWEGFVEVVEEPELERGKQVVRFRVIDSNLYGTEREKQLATGVVWDWMKEYAQPRLAELRIDLGKPLREIAELLPLFLPPESVARTKRMLDSVALVRVETSEIGLRVDVRFELDEPPARDGAPPSPTPLAANPAPTDSSPSGEGAAPAPSSSPAADAGSTEPPLTPAEIAAFTVALRQVDSFLTFVVKQSGADAAAAELRDALLEVLLDERYDLVDALASPRRDARDPVRAIFLESWTRLAPVLRRIAPTLPAPLALRYLSFVSAGDALRALDDVGPSTGLEISADGLRRLARMIAPAATTDPLAYTVEVDPELRTELGFGAPLPPPEIEAESDARDATGAPQATPSSPDAAVEPSPTAAIAPPTPTAAEPTPPLAPAGATTPTSAATTAEETPADAPSSVPGPSPVSRRSAHPSDSLFAGDAIPPAALRALHALALVGASDAIAAEPPSTGAEDDVVRRLNRWAPKTDELDRYLPLVRDLLQTIATERARADALDDRFAGLFRSLVPATAWQESCWRQFVVRSGELVPLRSPVGAVGIMQVNQGVWRGFYDLEGLRRDMRYNARAGAEILSQYIRRHVVGSPRHASHDESVATAAYAAYNGGPGQLRRYEQNRVSKRERAVYAAFRAKMGKIRGGDALAVRACFEG